MPFSATCLASALVIVTSAPSLAKAIATARPIPESPPVIGALRPLGRQNPRSCSRRGLAPASFFAGQPGRILGLLVERRPRVLEGRILHRVLVRDFFNPAFLLE
jgi:hypothetical protein